MPFFVAVGHNGLRLVSEDGTVWKNQQLGKEGEVYRAVAYGNGRFVTVGSYGGDNIVAATSDGTTWQTGKKSANYVKYFRGLGYNAGNFFGIGGDPGSVGSSKPFISTSQDGLSWSDNHEIGGKHIIRRLAFGNGLMVGVGDRGRRVMSRDGRVWKDAPEAKAIDTLVDISFGNGRFVGVGLNALRMSSADGLTWTTPQRGNEGEHLNTVIWAGDKFIAIGLGATYISPDGLHWDRQPNSDAPLTATWGDGVFIGANWRGRLLRSTDGIVWQQVHRNEHHIEAIAFGG